MRKLRVMATTRKMSKDELQLLPGVNDANTSLLLGSPHRAYPRPISIPAKKLPPIFFITLLVPSFLLLSQQKLITKKTQARKIVIFAL